MSAADPQHMRAALAEARRGLRSTSPNPAVGAVLVVAGRIVARGHHRKAGGPHAEVECLRAVRGKIPKNAILYVTLEPCSTTGRTPPCTEEIIRAGVRRIVIGTIDVNPRHAGRGLALLREAGIEVQVGLLEEECAALNEGFNKWIVTGKPFVIAKCGMSLDGYLTRPRSEPPWITSPAARRHAHELRAKVDAILVGAETVRTDNPRLTVRGIPRAKQPLRVILSRSGALPKKAHVLTDRFAKETIIYRDQPLESVLEDLGRKNVTSLLIEGGGEVLGQALEERAIDKLQLYLGPILTGGNVLAFPGRGAASSAEAIRLQGATYRKIGHDICVTGYAVYPSGKGIE